MLPWSARGRAWWSSTRSSPFSMRRSVATVIRVFAAEGNAPAPSSRDRAYDFLAGFLADGPRTSREIWDAAREQGLAERTLYRAREQLRVRIERVQMGTTRLHYWLLPRQRVPKGL